MKSLCDLYITHISYFCKRSSIHIRLLLLLSIVAFAMIFCDAEVFAEEVGNDLTAYAGNIVQSGTCGDDLVWELSKDGVFTVTGTGQMNDYSYDNSPATENWRKVKKIVLDDRITYIGNYAFSRCQYVSGELKLPDSLVSIGECAFNFCQQLNGTLEIPQGVTEIGSGAFSGCSQISEINLNEGLKTIDSSAFSNCMGLKGEVVIPDSVTSIGFGAFQDCRVTDASFVFGNGLKTIGDSAFYGSTFSGSLVLPERIESIGGYAFANCSGFTGSLVIPESVTFLGDSAFYGCSGITGDVVIPKGIENIDNFTFKETGITRICGYGGTDAERYARENGIEFLDLGNSVLDPVETDPEKYAICAADKSTHRIIPNAEIHIDYDKYNTDGSGIYEFIDISEGEHFVRAAADGYCMGSWQKREFGKGKLTVVFLERNAYQDAETSYITGMLTGADTVSGTVSIDSVSFNALNTLDIEAVENGCKNKPVYVVLQDGKISSVDLLENKVAPDIKLSAEDSPVTYIKDGDNTWENNLILSVGWKLPDGAEPSESVKNMAVEFDTAELSIIGQPSFAFMDETLSENSAYIKSVSLQGYGVVYGQYTPEIKIPFHISSSYTAEPGTVTENNGVLCNVVHNSAPNYSRLDIPISNVEQVRYSVEFDTQGGSPVESQQVNENGTATEPEPPVKEGYTFKGWYDDDMYDFAAPVTRNIILTAVWEEEHIEPPQINYTVIFDSDGGSAITPQIIPENGLVTVPESPSKEGYDFTGWYLNGVIYDFGTPVTAEIILKAGWEKREEVPIIVSFTVVFNSNGGSYVASQQVSVNGLAIEPEAPTRDGYIFAGWYLGIEKYDFSIPVTSPIVLEAAWNKISVTPAPSDDSKWGDILKEDRPASISEIPKGLWIPPVQEKTYTGKAVKPDIRVYDGTKRLSVNKDYTVSFKNNTKAHDGSAAGKAPTATVTFKGNYSGRTTRTFTIARKDISDGDVVKTFTDAYSVPNKGNPKIIFSAVYNGIKLVKGKDYGLEIHAVMPDGSKGGVTASYSEAGSYIMTVKGKGSNYVGYCDFPFVVTTKIPVSRLTVGKIKPVRYTGNPCKPVPVIKNGKTRLAEGAHYRLEYINNIAVGTASIKVTGLGEYAGTRTVKFSITGIPIKKVKFSGFKGKVAYTGDPIRQDNVTIHYDGHTLTDKDYSVEYLGDTTNAGKVTAVYTGKGLYSGTVKKTYSIIPYGMGAADQTRVRISGGIISVRYSKGGSKPSVVVMDGTKKLTEGVDYTLSYKNNRAARGSWEKNAPAIIVKGKGNYKGTLKDTKEFTIEKKNLSDVAITAPDVAASTLPGKFKSVPVLNDDGVKLKAGTDYSRKYVYTYKATGKPVGDDDIVPYGTVICVSTAATGKNYEGVSNTAEYRIVPVLINKAKVSVKYPHSAKAFFYTGNPITPGADDFTVRIGNRVLTAGKEFEIEEDSYRNNINIGTASVRIRGIGDTYGGSVNVSFRIGAKRF